MKMIDTGYGNSGALTGARQKVLREKPFRYIIITTSGGIPGMIGGSFNYEVKGTNNFGDLLNRDVIRGNGGIIDTETSEGVKQTDLAKQYLEFLSEEERTDLINEMLLKFLTT